MYCESCGSELPTDADFCPSCGTKAPENSQRSTRASFPVLPLAIAAAAAIAIGAGAALAYTNANQNAVQEKPVPVAEQTSSLSSNSSLEVSSSQAASSEASSSASSSEEALDPAQQALKNIEGWWVTVGNSQSIFYRFRGSTMEGYSYDFVNNTGYSYNGAGTIASVEPLGLYPDAASDTNGYSINIESSNQFRYYLRDAQPDFLECHWEATGYSGSDSLGRLEDVPAELAELGEQIDRENENSNAAEQTSAAAQPTSAAGTTDYHIVAPSYEFDIPQYWRGKVDVEQEDDVTWVYPVGTNLQLIRIDIEPPEYERQGGDVGSGNVWSQQRADGNYVVVRSASAGMFGGGRSTPPLSNYSAEQLDQYADLLTSGTYTAEDLIQGARTDYAGAAAIPELTDSIVVK